MKKIFVVMILSLLVSSIFAISAPQAIIPEVEIPDYTEQEDDTSEIKEELDELTKTILKKLKELLKKEQE